MKRVLINVEDHELRIAILEGEQLTELYIESLDNRTILNNIYKGRVEGVLPGLSAAFVNIGFERNAFLHFDDVRPDLLLELQASRQGPALSPNAMATPAPAENGVYQPSPEELEVLTSSGVVAPEPPVVAALEATPSGEGQPRKRRRGRRGGRRRRRNKSLALPQTGATAAAEDVASSLPTPASESPSATQTPGVSEQARLEVPAPPPAPAHGSASSSGGSSRRARRRAERRSTHAQPRDRAGRSRPVVIPPPDAIRGTRAATDPFDVFTPYALPKKQKSDRKRRKKTAPKTLDQLFGPTTLPPDVPIEKDSQVDFFGPARPDTYDEPAEDVSDSVPQGPSDEFLDETNGNVASAPSGPEAPHRHGKKPRNRSMRRKGPAPYALRRKKIPSEEEAAPSATPEGESAPSPPKRKRSAKKSATQATVATDVDATPTTSPTEEPAPAAKRVRSSRKSARTASVDAETAEPATPSAPVTDEASGDEIPRPKSRSRKRAAKTADTEPTAAPMAAEAALDPAATPRASISTGRKSRSKRQKPAEASVLEAALERRESTESAEPLGQPEDLVPSESMPLPSSDGAMVAELMAPGPATETPPASPSPLASLDGLAGSCESGKVESIGSSVVSEEPSAAAAQTSEVAPPAAEPSFPAAVASASESATVEAPAGPSSQPPALSGVPVHHDRSARRSIPKVHEVLRKGDEILVQVTKEEIGGKGARISTYVSLPGRYLVLLPYGHNEGGVSRRVDRYEERRRLKRLQRKIRQELGIEHMGLIIRTAGTECGEEELRKDAEFLLAQWRRVEERAAKVSAPALVYDDSDILYRLCRDVFDEEIDEIIVDSPEYADKIRNILSTMVPKLADRVHLYEEPTNIFARYGVEEKIRKAGRRKVWLKSGGYIIIDEAEALTAIDVNTGKFVGKDNQEQMILKTNLEAAQVIARELKLRDIGGLIVIDFIDMRDPRNREALLNEFRALLRKDHAKTSVSGISEFGLVEMTRKRVRQSLRKTIFTECPYCRGSGIVFSEHQIWVHIKNAIIEILETSYPKTDLVLHVNPTMKEFIENQCREALQRIQERYGVQLSLEASEKIHVENYQIEKRSRFVSALDALVDGGATSGVPPQS